MSERKGIAVGVLTQKIQAETHSVAYFPKKLDGTALGGQDAIAATSLLVEKAMKITLGQQPEVLTPHQVRVTCGFLGIG
jgi:hypothetical protein